MVRRFTGALAAAALMVAVPGAAIAGWKVMAPHQPVLVGKSTLKVTPGIEWNRSSARPGPSAEMWTVDGLALNELLFVGGVAPGATLIKDRHKKDRPLPRFAANMLAPDIVQLYEGTIRNAVATSLFEIDNVAPAKLAGHDGVHFTFHYAVQDEDLRRNGEARAAVIGGKLYLIAFQGPALHYFGAGIGEARAIMDSAAM
ncbi:hypothetical protein [Sphingomonas hengshuiensis]|nr:hypothetical protein [Sphingomonas hengshuiensis]